MRTSFIIALATLCFSAAVSSAAPLKVLPLGDSITNGFGSPDGTGYRKLLSDRLHTIGIDIDYVGQFSDTRNRWLDNQHEGLNGYPIKLINNQVPTAMSYEPDVVLLMAGSNDAWRAPTYNDPDITVANMIPNMRALMNSLYAQNPDVTVIVSTIPHIYDAPADNDYQAVYDYNAQLPGLVSEMQALGHKMKLVDFFARTSINELYDGVHPDAIGYQHLSDTFFDGFTKAGLVPEPTAATALVLAEGLFLRRTRSAA